MQGASDDAAAPIPAIRTAMIEPLESTAAVQKRERI